MSPVLLRSVLINFTIVTEMFRAVESVVSMDQYETYGNPSTLRKKVALWIGGSPWRLNLNLSPIKYSI